MSSSLFHALLVLVYLVGMGVLFWWWTRKPVPRSVHVGNAPTPEDLEGARRLLATAEELRAARAAGGPVTLRVDGWDVVVRREAPPDPTRIEVRVPGAVGDFEATLPASAAALDASNGARTELLLDGLLHVDGGARLQDSAIGSLAALVRWPGVRVVRLVGEVLVVEEVEQGAGEIELAAAIGLTLGVARALERRPLEVHVRGALVQGLAWTGGADARCPYCHDGLEGELSTCAECRTIHHTDCLAAGCTVLGCRARRVPGR